MTTNRPSNGLPILVPVTNILIMFIFFALFMKSLLYTDETFFKTYIYTCKDRHIEMTKKAIKWKEKK